MNAWTAKPMNVMKIANALIVRAATRVIVTLASRVMDILAKVSKSYCNSQILVNLVHDVFDNHVCALCLD